MWRLKWLDLSCLSHISVLSLIFCLQITNKKLQKLLLFVFKIKVWKFFIEIFALLIADWKSLMYSRSWLLTSSKVTNWYNHPCDDNITLTTFEGTLTTFEASEISRSESILFAHSKNVAWTRKLVLEIASKVHYLVLLFIHNISFFLHLNSFYLMPFNRLVSVKWIPSASSKIAVTGAESDWQITKIT